jgi:hypothetical protein
VNELISTLDNLGEDLRVICDTIDDVTNELGE